ncbi:MAG: DUF58 domain-containing protein [Spirochaetales bacterium]|nr:DUF58 domain-containing protein [Spirochaetales bacterium]
MEAGSRHNLHYEISKPFAHLPGVIIEIGADFIWKDRTISSLSRGGGGRSEGTISVYAERRGDYFCPGAAFCLQDFAGFFAMKLQAGQEEHLSVLPEKTESGRELDSLTPGGEEISRRSRKIRSDEMIEIRQYYPGDDIRRINWKAFAHSGELFIRVGEEKPLPESKLMIMLDLSDPSSFIGEKNSSIYLDYIISRLSGIIEKLSSAGITVELSVPPLPFKKVSDSGCLTGLFWRDDDGQPADIKGRPLGRSPGGNNCLLLTQPFSQNSAALCRRLNALGMSVTAAMPVPEGLVSGDTGLKLRDLFFSREISGEQRVIDEKTSAIIRDEALKSCRVLKTSGGVSNAFIT